MASSRTTFTIDEELAERARELGINVSAALGKASLRRCVPRWLGPIGRRTSGPRKGRRLLGRIGSLG